MARALLPFATDARGAVCLHCGEGGATDDGESCVECGGAHRLEGAEAIAGGGSFDVALAREFAEHLIAQEPELVAFEDWTRDRGLGPEVRERRCRSCAGGGDVGPLLRLLLPYQRRYVQKLAGTEGDECPRCRGTGSEPYCWPGELLAAYQAAVPSAARRDLVRGRRNARLGRWLMDALAGQESVCPECNGSACDECRGTGHNIRGRMPEIVDDMSAIAAALDARDNQSVPLASFQWRVIGRADRRAQRDPEFAKRLDAIRSRCPRTADEDRDPQGFRICPRGEHRTAEPKDWRPKGSPRVLRHEKIVSYPVEGGRRIEAGAFVTVSPGGFASAVRPPSLLGVALRTADNRKGLAGDARVELDAGRWVERNLAPAWVRGEARARIKRRRSAPIRSSQLLFIDGLPVGQLRDLSPGYAFSFMSGIAARQQEMQAMASELAAMYGNGSSGADVLARARRHGDVRAMTARPKTSNPDATLADVAMLGVCADAALHRYQDGMESLDARGRQIARLAKSRALVRVTGAPEHLGDEWVLQIVAEEVANAKAWIYDHPQYFG